MAYSDDRLLMLSGIQHYAYCPRQWALIHVEQEWNDNHLTLEGEYIHNRVDNPECNDYVRGIITQRSVPLISYELGICGISDIVEMHHSQEGITLPTHEGRYIPIPIEYKHGSPKSDSTDRVQACAQAICLEEMYKVSIRKGYLYYASTRHREEVVFNSHIRSEVKTICAQMHSLYEAGITPKAEYSNKCRNCSLYEKCMPKLSQKSNKVNEYINNMFNA